MHKYSPSPFNTSDIVLDQSLLDLQEQLAKNIHEVWAKGRLEGGWVYGKTRDDSKKQHPCLVPYEQLSEEEKSYDRNSAIETLKFILKLGYQITPPDTVVLSEQQMSAVQLELDNILNCKILSGLVSLWQNHNKTTWQSSPEVYYQLALNFIKHNEPLLAYDVLAEGIAAFPEPAVLSDKNRALYIRMNQQQALALAETGAVREAANILTMLAEYDNNIDAETFGLLGRVYKEMGLSEAALAEEKITYLKQAFDYYFTAFEFAVSQNNHDDAYYNGINAATVSLFIGDMEQSQSIAQQVADICREVIANCKSTSTDIMYWVDATLGEAELLLGNMDSAITYYQSAIKKTGTDMRGQMSMYRQALKILEHLKIDGTALLAVFNTPRIFVFSGHMIDMPGTVQQRFPVHCEAQVRQSIRQYLADADFCIAYCSAACGADIIFLEEVLEKGGEINIVLPFSTEVFKQKSVDLIAGSDWAERFDKVINKASRVVSLAQHNPEIEFPVYDFTNRFIFGMAQNRAAIIDSKVHCFSVWDGVSSKKHGGTASAIQLWLNQVNSIDYVHPQQGLKKYTAKGKSNLESFISGKIISNGEDVCYYNYLPLLFADVKGYSKLNEQQLVVFSTFFLNLISCVFDTYDSGILARRTQGDGLFVVFKNIKLAAGFASELNTIITQTQWQKHGLPADLTIRISLDAGPCYSYIEPVTGNLEFCGDYVNRAARMEPITPPGHIYASETFVSLANVESLDSFQFVYAGQVVLPKGHGIIPAYHMQKRQ